jgi:predicted Rossmann-fold nucleotide-binding protein
MVEAKQRTLTIAVFGGNDGSAASGAEQIGTTIATTTQWIVLTGGAGPVPNSPKVKERALVGPHNSKRPWIGVLQARDEPPPPGGDCTGFVFKTPLGDKRNYLEAWLCDGAIALKGKEGTLSEVVATLCLGKPVVLVGDHWNDSASGDWWNAAHAKLTHEPASPAIDALIERDVTRKHLKDAEKRYRIVTVNTEAIDSLASLLDDRGTP